MISKSVFIKKKRIMEKFSLEKYLADPSRKVVTRNGKSIRIIYTDKRDLNFPIVALIETIPGGEEVTHSYTKDGRHYTDCSDIFDLFFAPETHEGWINVYRHSDGGHAYAGAVYDSKEDAEKRKTIDENYVTTIKIEWEG